MTREIKFRCWDIFNKQMREDGIWMTPDGTMWQYADQGFLVNNLNADDKHKAYLREQGLPIQDEFVLMQYTGLKDKHGKDIYEGDILQYKHEYKCRAWNGPWENRSLATTQPDVTIGKDKVWFDNGCFRLGYVAYLHELPNVFKHGENHACEWTDTYTDFEVIGNIFENPELL